MLLVLCLFVNEFGAAAAFDSFSIAVQGPPFSHLAQWGASSWGDDRCIGAAMEMKGRRGVEKMARGGGPSTPQ